MDLTGLSRRTLSVSLQRLTARGLIRLTEQRQKKAPSRLAVTFLPAAQPVLRDLDASQADCARIRLSAPFRGRGGGIRASVRQGAVADQADSGIAENRLSGRCFRKCCPYTLAAEQKARVTYDNILRLSDDRTSAMPFKFHPGPGDRALPALWRGAAAGKGTAGSEKRLLSQSGI